MYLSELKLWNFRKYGNGDHLHSITNDTKPNLVVEFKPTLNVLIGENDSGKTAIIDAIKLVLNTKSLENSRIEDKDFYKPSTDKEQNRSTVLRIECKFKALNPAEAGSFLEWVGFDAENNYELTVWLTATRTKENRIITNIKAGADDEGIQLDGEARENLKVTYLKPLRDALSELTPGYKSRLAQILGGHDVFKAISNGNPEEKWEHELEKKAKEANNIIRDYFKIKNEGEKRDGGVITKDISDNLNALSFEGSVANPAVEITDDELSDILKTLKLVNDSNKAGLGSLNKLYMAAEFLLLKQSKGRELQLALIEEIEAHLHPQAQLKVIDALQTNDNLNKGQIILTTHSTTLASKVNLDNLILCHEEDVYPMFNDGKHTKLDQKDYEFLERFLDATKANLFFARGVIMVEGDAENLLIPTIAEIIGKQLHDYGISIVNVGSTAFMRYAKIFQRVDGKTLKIPVACVTDLDIKQKIQKNGKVIVVKRKSGKAKIIPTILAERQKKQKIEGDHVKVLVSPLWTLEYDILNSEELTRKLLFQSILEAQLIENRENYSGLNEKDEQKKEALASKFFETNQDESKEWIACKIYSNYLENNKVSKAITAQRFAYHLLKKQEEVYAILKTAPEFEYIREAIYHVTKQPEK